jgi:hypothetical protein
VGAALAKRLGDGWVFADADAYHPQANIDKMANGQPLNGATAFALGGVCTQLELRPSLSSAVDRRGQGAVAEEARRVHRRVERTGQGRSAGLLGAEA